jgi:hypothetical protein
MELWTKALDEGISTDVILYLDFKKALDSVPNKRILEEMESLGITGNTQLWITWISLLWITF